MGNQAQSQSQKEIKKDDLLSEKNVKDTSNKNDKLNDKTVLDASIENDKNTSAKNEGKVENSDKSFEKAPSESEKEPQIYNELKSIDENEVANEKDNDDKQIIVEEKIQTEPENIRTADKESKKEVQDYPKEGVKEEEKADIEDYDDSLEDIEEEENGKECSESGIETLTLHGVTYSWPCENRIKEDKAKKQ